MLSLRQPATARPTCLTPVGSLARSIPDLRPRPDQSGARPEADTYEVRWASGAFVVFRPAGAHRGTPAVTHSPRKSSIIVGSFSSSSCHKPLTIPFN